MVKIMVVDDNDDIRFTIIKTIETKYPDYEFIEAESGEACMDNLKVIHPDLLIMDIMMPGFDGIDTVVKIKKQKDYENIKVIYLTARSDNLTKEMGELTGDDYIIKPFEPDELIEHVEKVLRQQ